MKNNIRYKGNTNNTFVIIFLNVKNSQRFYFAWKNLLGGFCDVVVLHFIFVSSFVDVLHFVVVSSFVDVSSFRCCSSFTFSFRRHNLTLPWTMAGFLHPFHTFSPSHCRVICDTLIFRPSRYLLAASINALRWQFLPTDIF